MENLELLFDGEKLAGKYLYHYTNAAGFHGILQNNRVWATSYEFLNDPSEHVYGHKIVKTVLENLIAKTNNPILLDLYNFRFNPPIIASNEERRYYIFSLVEDKDSAHHWKEYGNNFNGFAIEFEINSNYKEMVTHTEGSFPHKLFKVIYDIDEQIKITENILLAMARSGKDAFSIDYITEYLCIKFKDSIYSPEKEWRIVYSPVTNAASLGNDVFFRNSNDALINYNSFQLDKITGVSIGSQRPESEGRNILQMFVDYLNVFPPNFYKSTLSP